MREIEDPMGEDAAVSSVELPEPDHGLPGGTRPGPPSPSTAEGSESCPAPGALPTDPAPPPDPTEPETADPPAGGLADDRDALVDEARVVEAAAALPAEGKGPRRDDPENSFLLATLTLAVLLFFGWIAGTTLWDLRRELGVLRDRVQRIETDEHTARVARDRAALARALAELEGLEATLPPDLARQVSGARQSLKNLSQRLGDR